MCVVKTDGALFCWGGNDFGQLGNGNLDSQTNPQRVNLAASKVLVGTDSTTSCAVPMCTSRRIPQQSAPPTRAGTWP